MDENAVRCLFQGAYLEFDMLEVRVYARPGLDAVRSAMVAADPKVWELVGHSNFVLYGGVEGELEEDGREDLMREVLEDPKMQMVMMILGARLESVVPDRKRPA